MIGEMDGKSALVKEDVIRLSCWMMVVLRGSQDRLTYTRLPTPYLFMSFLLRRSERAETLTLSRPLHHCSILNTLPYTHIL